MNYSKPKDISGFNPGEMYVTTGRPKSSTAILAEIRSKFGLPKEANAVRPNERRAGRLDHIVIESPTRQIQFGVMLEIGDPGLPAALAAYADECRKLGKRDQSNRFVEMCEWVHQYQRSAGITASAAFDRKREQEDQLARHPEIQRTKDEEMRRAIREEGLRLGDPFATDNLAGASASAIRARRDVRAAGGLIFDHLTASRDISAGEAVNGEDIEGVSLSDAVARHHAKRRENYVRKIAEARAEVAEAERRLDVFDKERAAAIERDRKFEAAQAELKAKEDHHLADLKSQAAEERDRGASSLSAFLAERFEEIATNASHHWSVGRNAGDVTVMLHNLNPDLLREEFQRKVDAWKAAGKIIDFS